MARLTKHGEKRISERLGATDNAALRNANKAMRHGLQHKETFGELRRWLDGKFLSNSRKADQMRIYMGRLYVFSHGFLITVFELPVEITALLPECVEPDAYDRYQAQIENVKSRKYKQKSKEYKMKRLEFRRLVLLNDIRDYAENRYSVEISGIGIEGMQVRVYYIPTDYEIPNLRGVSDYIKKHTKYRSVRLIHKKSMDGRPEYHIIESRIV